MPPTDFTQIVWNSDGFRIGDWVFRHYPEVAGGIPEAEESWFWIFKPKSMVDDYVDVFSNRPGFSLDRALELGIWDGGSVAFWSLIADPKQLAAIDLNDRGDGPYFKRFAEHHPQVHTSWSTNQSDEAALLDLIEKKDLAPLDFVVDDASHLYEHSKRSFEILFPRLRPGGLYCLEDWQWSFEPAEQSPNAYMALERPLVDLVHDLLAVMASAPELIAKIEVYPLFVMIERGPLTLSSTLRLESLIRRRHAPSLRRRWQHFRWRLRSRSRVRRPE